MDELIQQLTAKLGVDPQTARSATAKAMSLVKSQVGDDLFGKIAANIPGAAASADQPDDATTADGNVPAAGGMFGTLAGMASGLLGKSGGGALEIGSALAASGLKPDQISGFVTTLIKFLKEKIGDDVVDQIVAKVPVLKTFIG